MNLAGQRIELAAIRVAAQVDESAGLVDVAVYHPVLAELSTAAQDAMTFLPLDAALGERLAADHLGRVETAEQEPANALGLLEFRALVRGLAGDSAPGSGPSDTNPSDTASCDIEPSDGTQPGSAPCTESGGAE